MIGIIDVVILFLAAIVLVVFKKLGQPLVLGYLVAGFLASPYMPYMQALGMTEHMVHEGEAFGSFGVMFIMFSLGLEFSFKKLGKMGAAPIITALFITICMMALGYLMGMMMGWSSMNCIFLGGMLCMSSTAIINKAFDELGLSSKGFTTKVMSVLILEDIIAIVLLVMLSATAKGVSDVSAILGTVTQLAIFVAVSLIVGLLVLPAFFRMIRKIMNDEMLLFISVALLMGMAFLADYLGFSTAFGAFIMGSILSETLESHKIEQVMLPLKNYFSAIFFVSVGMMVNAETVITYWQPILILVLTIMIGQAIFGTMGYLIGGQPLHSAVRSGFAMSQIGEFSFIIAGVGVSTMTAAGSSAILPELYPIIVAVSVITTFFTPYMIKGADPAYNLLSKVLPDSLIEKLSNEKNVGVKDGEPTTFFARFWSHLFAHAKMKTGNLPRHCGEDVAISELLVVKGDLYDGSTVQEVIDLKENPFHPVGLTPDGELSSWQDLTPDYVFKPGDRVRVVSKRSL
ncbi:MAG: cation:proton antiporter [Muribaculaceae bacterium]|nr:cation:proton antiporter [Muribaculaceae bacterium]